MNEKLIRAVRYQLGRKSTSFEDERVLYFPDICQYGASNGFPGFTDYKDTVNFYRVNKKLILEHLVNVANELSEDPIVMIQNFNFIKGQFTTLEIAEALYSQTVKDDYYAIYNIMAWFALEEVARDYCNKKGI